MSWNNIKPAWMLNPTFKEATEKYHNDELTKQEVYEKIKDIKKIPDHIKENWDPDE